MTGIHNAMNDPFEIFINELMADEELRGSFLRNPSSILELASEWGLPLSESELRSLLKPSYRRWDRIVDELEARLGVAA